MAICIYRSVVLAPGEIFALPPNAELLGVDNLANVTSNCGLTNLEEAKCYVMRWAVNVDREPSPSIEASDYNLFFIIDNVEYQIINELGAAGPEVWMTSAAAITSVIPPGILTSPVLVNSDTGDRHAAYFTFSTIPSLAAVIKVKIIAPGYEGGLFVYPEEITC